MFYDIKITVPVKKYMALFLKEELSTGYLLYSKNPLWKILFCHLEVRQKNTIPKFDKDWVPFELLIPQRIYTRHKLSSLSKSSMYELHCYFEEYFNRLMIEWINARLSLKDKKALYDLLEKNDKKTILQINESIRDFLNKYGIEEHNLPFETIKKRFHRSVVRRKQLCE